MKRLFAIIFPIYNWGQAAVLLALLLCIALIALFSDPVLPLYMGVGGYLGVAINQNLLGLAPGEMEIEAHEIGPIEAGLGSAPRLTRLGDRLWAPRRYQSWWWESDRISIVERPGGKYVLKARRRDLKIIRESLGR
jgi:hypothetical protein